MADLLEPVEIRSWLYHYNEADMYLADADKLRDKLRGTINRIDMELIRNLSLLAQAHATLASIKFMPPKSGA